MTPHYKLVIDTFSAPTPSRSFAIHNLFLHQPQNHHQGNQTPSYVTVGLVIAAHFAVAAWLIYTNPSLPEVKEIPPMMVSLVSNPAPAPEIVPVIPEPPKPVIKKQTVVQKTVAIPTPTPTPVTPQAVAAEPVPVAEPTLPAPAVVTKNIEAVEKPVAKPEPEPVIEQANFGIAYLHNPAPSYPRMSMRKREHGRVLLRVTVSAKGEAEKVELEKTSGFTRLDEAAIKAVKEWKFEPAKRNSQAFRSIGIVPVNFSLED